MQIKGLEFTTPALPYKAGHVLIDREAAALNQTFLENIRNNNAKAIQEEIEKAAAEGRPPDMKGMQKTLDESAANYKFGEGRQTDPIETQARVLAKTVVLKNLRAAGIKVKDMPKKDLLAKIEKVLNDFPEVRKLARKQIDDAQKLRSTII